MKLAMFLPNWVGDAVMATPALRAIRRQFAGAEIVGIMRPVIAEVLEGTGLVDRALLVDPRSANEILRGPRLIRQLQAERCDTAVLFTNSLRTAWWAWRSGARRRIGFARDFRNWLLTECLEPWSRTVPNPVLDEYLRLADVLGCDHLSRDMTLAVSQSDAATLDSFWKQHPTMFRMRGVVCFNTGGAFGPAKNWLRESFVELAQRIVDRLGKTVLIVCGPAERDEARWIAAAARRPNVLSLAAEPLSIGLTKAAIRNAELLVTTDSGPRHFAAAFDVPVITLFGPTHIAWSETYYPRSIHLQVPIDCGPCQQRECPLRHHRCMTELTVDRVFDAVRQAQTQFARQPLRAAA